MLIWLFAPSLSYALTITEIYPNASDGETEWVEVYNDSTSPLNTSDYVLVDKTDKKIQFQDTSINSLSYGVAISSGVLNNTGDTIRLIDTAGTVKETVEYPSGVQTGSSYQKCPDSTWVVATTTKQQDNTSSCHTQQPTSIESSVESFDSIIITEIHPNPLEGNEWIELYNLRNSQAQLTDWYLDDVTDGGSKPIPFTLSIPPRSFATIYATSNMFNNSGDTVRIMRPDGDQEVISVTYPSTAKGISYAKKSLSDDVFCLQESSPSSISSACLADPTSEAETTQPTMKLTPTKKPSPSPTKKITKIPTKQSAVLGTSAKNTATGSARSSRDSSVVSALDYTDTGQTSDSPHKISGLVALLALSSALGAGLITIKNTQQ